MSQTQNKHKKLTHLEENVNSAEYIKKLAQPKKHNMSSYEADPEIWKVKRSCLKYKATKRIQLLARPKYVTKKKIDREEDEELESIPSVTPSALNYRPTRRILELATPK